MNLKNVFKKDNVMPVVVLAVICLVVAALLGAVNMLTKDKIADNEQQKVYSSLKEALDGYIIPVTDLPAGVADTVTGIYEVTESDISDVLIGKIVTVKVKGYAGDISMTVGVKADGTVNKVIITSQSESHGKAGMATYPDSFAGVASDKVGEVELFSGATISSTAIRGGVVDAVNAAQGTGNSEEPAEVLPRTDEEIVSLASQMVGDGVTLTDVTPSERDLVKRVYKASGSKGYVAYTVVMSQYGTVETETLIHFDNTGKIVGVNKLVWKTSDAMYGYEPPVEATVNEFYAKLAGNTSATFAEKFIKGDDENKVVEHVSNATSTTTKLVTAIAEAFGIVEELIKNDIPRAESEVIDLAKTLIGDKNVELTDATPANTSLVKRVYKSGNSKGYVAYTVVMSQYGTVETETLVHFDNTGKIVSVNKLVWKTSDAMYGYEPPVEATVNEFYAKLAGNTSATFAEKFIKGDDENKVVEHVSNATSTTTKLVTAIAEAFEIVDGYVKNDVARAESEIVELSKTLVGGDNVDLSDVTPSDAKSVKRIYKIKGGKGYVAYTVVMSRYGTVETETLIHFDNTGKIVNVSKLIWKTSDAMYGYVPPVEATVNEFYAKLAGNTAATFAEKFIKSEGENKVVEHVSNATSTTNNLVATIAESFEIVDRLIREDIPKTDEEVQNLATDLVGGSVTLKDITPENTAFVKRLYKVSGDNKGYVAYTVVISQYGTVETETLIYIDNSGKIVGVNKLTWKTSDAMYGYVPPVEATVNEFYAKLAGNTSATFAEKFIKGDDENKVVEHVSNATSTTTKLVTAIAEAFELIDDQIKKDIPRAESEVIELAGQLAGEGVTLTDVTPGNSNYVKRLYKLSGGKGYIAYTVVMSQYGTVETETLVHFNIGGVISGVNKLVWKTSDAMYGYEPPVEATVNEFYAKLAGNTSATFAEKFIKGDNENKVVEHVANATSTTTKLVTAIAEAFGIVDELLKNDLPREESEVIDLAGQLAGEGASLTDVTPANTSYVKRLYKLNDGNGFVAYTVVISRYGTVETETLVHFDNNGTIVGVKKLVWKTSDAMYGYEPPVEATVNEFYAKLAGNNSASFADKFIKGDDEDKSVDHVANATNTTDNLVSAIKEAFDLVDGQKEESKQGEDYTARIVGIVILALAIICPVSIIVYTEIKRRKS